MGDVDCDIDRIMEFVNSRGMKNLQVISVWCDHGDIPWEKCFRHYNGQNGIHEKVESN